jgi:hypothetical protein
MVHFIAKSEQIFGSMAESLASDLKQDLFTSVLLFLQTFQKNLIRKQIIALPYSVEICKTMWSLSAIAGHPSQIIPHYKILISLLLEHNFTWVNKNQTRLSTSEAFQIYQTYLYTKNNAILPSEFVDNLKSLIKEYSLNQIKDVSMLHLEVCKVVERMKISYKIEDKLEDIDVDIILGDIFEDYMIVIDIHGYQHYFRNAEVLKGNNIFKRKLVRALGYKYFEIPIFVWQGLFDEDSKYEYIEKGIVGLMGQEKFAQLANAGPEPDAEAGADEKSEAE